MQCFCNTRKGTNAACMYSTFDMWKEESRGLCSTSCTIVSSILEMLDWQALDNDAKMRGALVINGHEVRELACNQKGLLA